MCTWPTLLALYAYNNFDVDLKSHVPTAEKSNNSLKHLTSGLLFPLSHGITADDLKCSDKLWRMSTLNPHIEANLPPKNPWQDLLCIHPESSSTNQPSRRDQFNAWVFLSDLCTHGPDYFHQFKVRIAEPEAIDQICTSRQHRNHCRPCNGCQQFDSERKHLRCQWSPSTRRDI
ncbi:hypothetical protein JVT61DRAFT_8686 [Boletus reticuloceps]|uniref:Uncharacterized protein n=1 Tax=Boletus reticuloceps TaxID=495285 RepID=A0A8I2Z0N6_9AGAM|nr:hypothetical protein JVT61DRAFT_8686 [Boletus reticuloceps]